MDLFTVIFANQKIYKDMEELSVKVSAWKYLAELNRLNDSFEAYKISIGKILVQSIKT